MWSFSTLCTALRSLPLNPECGIALGRRLDTGLSDGYVVEITTTYLPSLTCIYKSWNLAEIPCRRFRVRRVHFAHCFISLICPRERRQEGRGPKWLCLLEQNPFVSPPLSASLLSGIMNVWIYRTNHCAMMRDVSTLAHSSICLIFPVEIWPSKGSAISEPAIAQYLKGY